MNETRRCLYCQSSFLPSRHRPQQRVCSRPDCQRQRRANSRRQKLATDVEYRQVVRDSQKHWWDEHLLWLANCYFAHNSLRFPALLPFFNASSPRPFHPPNRRPDPVVPTWRRPFPRC